MLTPLVGAVFVFNQPEKYALNDALGLLLISTSIKSELTTLDTFDALANFMAPVTTEVANVP